MKHGLELLGAEMGPYVAGTGHHQQNKEARNSALVGNVQKISQDISRNCLMTIGADNGVDLMLVLKDTPIKNFYTHLYCDSKVIDKTTRSQSFRREIETGGFKLGE